MAEFMAFGFGVDNGKNGLDLLNLLASTMSGYGWRRFLMRQLSQILRLTLEATDRLMVLQSSFPNI
jgi:hypothetical protein